MNPEQNNKRGNGFAAQPVQPAPPEEQEAPWRQKPAGRKGGGKEKWIVVAVLACSAACIAAVAFFAFPVVSEGLVTIQDAFDSFQERKEAASSALDKSGEGSGESKGSSEGGTQKEADDYTSSTDDSPGLVGAAKDEYLEIPKTGWETGHGYTVEAKNCKLDEARQVANFDNATVTYRFDIDYPQFSGNIAKLDEVNAALEERAMHAANKFLAADDDARKCFDVVRGRTGVNDAEGSEAYFSSEVAYSITYCDDNLISVVFMDDVMFASAYLQFLRGNTININVKTGEIYKDSTGLNMTEAVANEWIDGYLAASDHGDFLLEIYAREQIVSYLMGEQDEERFVAPTFFPGVFVDRDGHVGVIVTVAASTEGSSKILRCADPVSLSPETAEGGKQADCSLWSIVPVAQK